MSLNDVIRFDSAIAQKKSGVVFMGAELPIQIIGNTCFLGNGETIAQIGNFYICSNGEMVTKTGSLFTSSNGETAYANQTQLSGDL
jgi:hypothetical protein